MAPDPMNPARDPACMPSLRAQRSIEKASARRKAGERGLSVALAVMLVFSGVLVFWLALYTYLKRFHLVPVLWATLMMAGCCGGPDERKVALVLEEIAILGSMAQLPGPRTQVHVDAINVRTQTVQKNVLELVK